MSAQPTISPLRGEPPRAPHHSQAPLPPQPPPAAAGRGDGPLLAPHVARLLGFVGLAAFSALQWAAMVSPIAGGALMGCVLAGAAAGYGLATLARRRAPAGVRFGAVLLAALALVMLALAAAGVPGRLFGPRAWDELASGIGQGLGAVSTVRTPYGGLDEWTRIVIVLGGCLLVGCAALVAFAPRAGGRFGFPAAAALVLGALYTVPVMQHNIDLPWLAGLLFTLLLATFLWLERVERRVAALAVGIVAAAAFGGYAGAPVLDSSRALLDYEEIAQSLSPTATARYRWNHSYGPLDWPRDGREVLRVRARQRAYWKAVNLVAFDGIRWVQDTGQARDHNEDTVFDPAWRQTIRVTLRALRTSQYVAAGSTIDILDSPRGAMSLSPGTYETTGQSLRRGHSYQALVYTPRPSVAQQRQAGADYPLNLPREYGLMRLPRPGFNGALAIAFPRWFEEGPPTIIGSGSEDARGLLADSPYGEVYALARRLRAGAATPYDYVRAIERHLADGFGYAETPPPSRIPLADFLLRDRIGYCQQFSGAMALLLRMGGVPARVASGFSPGSLDTDRKEYVVRDVDAHSWVEYYAPGIGWVTRDPTPPDSPARDQLSDLAADSSGGSVAFTGSERALERALDTGPVDPLSAADDDEGGPGTALVAGLLLALLLLGATAALALRGRMRRRARAAAGATRDDDLEELVRALRRSGRPPPPQLTLETLAARYTGTAAQDYVRTLAAARFGYGRVRPSRAQRTALRHELADGLGARGRLRAWWALPPHVRRRPTR